jgi:hypothetical protein
MVNAEFKWTEATTAYVSECRNIRKISMIKICHEPYRWWYGWTTSFAGSYSFSVHDRRG